MTDAARAGNRLRPVVRRRLAGNLASMIGGLLDQNYRRIDGQWWLCNGDTPKRELKPDEIAWHVERDHAPFAEGGVEKTDPRWWDDPPNNALCVKKEGGDE